MAASPNSDKPKRRRRDRGDDGIWWDRANRHYVGAVSLGFDGDGKRNRPTVRGRTRAEVKGKLDKLHDELNAGIHAPATYTVEQCVKDWFASIERDEHTMQTLTGQARKWIYPRIGATKLKDFSATDAVKFFQQIAPFLSKRTLVMIKSTLRRSIRRAQVHDLIGRNVIELIDLPAGKPGRPSRAMTQDQAAKVLKTANGGPTGYVKVVKASSGRYGATHAATESGQLACGTKSHWKAPITEVSRELKDATCLSCRSQLGLDNTGNANQRLAALFVLSITLGLRPGELRMLTWDYVDFDGGVVHVWRSASKTGDTKTPQSKRSLMLPKRAITALTAHKAMQDRERREAGKVWQDLNLVFCHEDGSMYKAEALNWRFSKMTKKAGIGHWHAHEGRHTAVSIMSSNGVPIQEISDTVGHKSTHVTETVYRHVIVPAIRGGATVMDSVFGDENEESV
jgi:integrase